MIRISQSSRRKQAGDPFFASCNDNMPEILVLSKRKFSARTSRKLSRGFSSTPRIGVQHIDGRIRQVCREGSSIVLLRITHPEHTRKNFAIRWSSPHVVMRMRSNVIPHTSVLLANARINRVLMNELLAKYVSTNAHVFVFGATKEQEGWIEERRTHVYFVDRREHACA